MKTTKFFAVALAALALVGCKPEQKVEALKSITISQATATLAVGETLQLTATTDPVDAKVTLTWAAQDPTVASVDANGFVTALKDGSTFITVSAEGKSDMCILNVGAAVISNQFLPLLEDGTNYYVFAMGDQAFAKLGNKVKDDFRINGQYAEDGSIPAETTSVLEIWGNTFTGGAGGGLNCFDQQEGYISLVSQKGDWDGNGCGGLRQIHRTVDLSAITEDYTLVIAYKCAANNSKSAKVKFTLYSTVENGKNVEKEVAGNTDGEWTLLEYSIKDLKALGLDWSKPYVWTEGSEKAFFTLGFLIEPTGQTLDIDAVFVYQKNK